MNERSSLSLAFITFTLTGISCINQDPQISTVKAFANTVTSGNTQTVADFYEKAQPADIVSGQIKELVEYSKGCSLKDVYQDIKGNRFKIVLENCPNAGKKELEVTIYKAKVNPLQTKLAR